MARRNPDVVAGIATNKWQPLYDSYRFLSVGVNEIKLFKTGVSTGDSAFFPGNPKRVIDTNLDSSGKLVNNQSMIVKALRAKYSFATRGLETNSKDLDELLFAAELEINIGGTRRWEGQLKDILSGIGQQGFAATTNATKYSGSQSYGVPDARALYLLYDKPFTIAQDQSLNVTIRFGTAPTLTNAVILTFQFEGEQTGDIVG